MAEQKQCTVDDCLRPLLARGLCRMHYQRVQRLGFPGGPAPRKASRDQGGCSVNTCERPLYAKGLCGLHYNRQQRGADLEAPVRKSRQGTCSAPGCNRSIGTEGAQELCRGHYRSMRLYGDLEHTLATVKFCSLEGCEAVHYGQGYCVMHYQRWQRTGNPGPVERLRKTSGEGHLRVDGYRYIQRDGRMQAEHRFVMEQNLGRKLLNGENVHHINGVRNDNRPENLELWVTFQPVGQRPHELLAWAYQIIERYGSEFQGAGVSGSCAPSPLEKE